ncbi:DUF5134 domain-containing protein [Croceicoccus bisphenolivorans]|uniref:DUF5134 domain-containing protein n=1 Tax=Croceicoccus bisphenolivorans TaxID=1783232 RepID=UPI00082ACCFF|nr:DUF5134 domain-containing protein [Croceicoccus bisphenolivorans]
MTGSLPFLLLFAVAAAFSLYELVGPGANGRSWLSNAEAHAAHVVMNGVMAAMFAPLWGTLAERVAFWILAVAAVVLVCRFAFAVRGGKGGEAGGSAYHALATVAMIYAIVLMPAGNAPSHHAGMHHADVAATPLAATVIGLVFTVDAIATLVLAFAMPARLLESSAADYAAQKAELRRSALPHVVMDAGMAIMLL